MNFKHSFNNGSGNKPQSNQQQNSPNQGNNFNVVPQQQYQQGGTNQNYNPLNSGQDGQMPPQYGQQGGQNFSQQQYFQPKNTGEQQYQQSGINQNYNRLNSSEGNQSQQQNLMQRPPQNIGQSQYDQQSNIGSQYQQNSNAQNYNAMSANQRGQLGQNMTQQQYYQQNRTGFNPTPSNVQPGFGQGMQNQPIAERIANVQNSNRTKPSDLLTMPIDPNLKVGLGKNMNIGVPMTNELGNNDQQGNYQTGHQFNANLDSDKIKCQCKNCCKKARPWLTVLVTLLIVLAILGGCVGAIYGFRSQIRDWLNKPDITTETITEDSE